jgi:hypothetical protein
MKKGGTNPVAPIIAVAVQGLIILIIAVMSAAISK